MRLLPADGSGSPARLAAARPLERLVVTADIPGSVEVSDGAGRIYFRSPLTRSASFLVGGALGVQNVLLRDAKGAEAARESFTVDAQTRIDDGGKYGDMFALFRASLTADVPGGVMTEKWNGKTYHFFVHWVLDNYHTGKGMKYFSADVRGLVDVMRAAQREDGMIWSNMHAGDAVAYYKTAYGPFGYARQYGDRLFVRQPAENHPEYIYVSTIYQVWKATGDDAWMRACLDSGMRALDYCVTDPARWSLRFQLLKRVYTIDSWDFQVEDAYTPDIGLTNTMLIDPKKSKFGVFFGDNVYYAASCEEISEMLRRTGDGADADKYAARARDIRARLDSLSWNGRFFTHFIDEDPTVKRDLGVDTSLQIAQGNAYALNRGIRRDQAQAILRTYQDLERHLPVGSPGEWYAIYPPFQKGFGRHDEVWQYMNGGVGGHVAGELARGAFENGFEAYGRDILDRLTALGHAHGDRVHFAYTGSIPPPPPAPVYTPLDLSSLANMDTWAKGGPSSAPWMLSKREGDDIRGLPTGRRELSGITFQVADPAANGRRSVVAVSRAGGLPEHVDVPVGGKAGAVYLLHTSTKPTSENVCGCVTLSYEDGTRLVQYVTMGKQLTYWWFPQMKTKTSGVAWHGPSPVAEDVGLSWCVVDNPHPEKLITSIRLSAPEDDGIYAVAGITLADRKFYIPPDPVSYGGPDDWAGATAMAALVEGLAGVRDGPGSGAFDHPVVAPRWDLAKARGIDVSVRYPASEGYVAYHFASDPEKKSIEMTLAGNGPTSSAHILLPTGARARVSVGGVQIESR
ncbi:MAG TPA: hypothetical protein VGG37_00545, partial [Opitutaceae bacterium]